MRREILAIPLLLLFALCASGYQQTPANTGATVDDTHARMLGLVRSINTVEASEKFEHGSYASWPALLQRHADYFNDWLARFGPVETGKATARGFAALPEVLPNWKLRITLSADGRSYMVLLQDAQDKHGFAFVAEESGVIRDSKYIE